MKVVAEMTFENMHYFLSQQYSISGIKDVPYGKQIKLDNGAVVIVYDKGTYLVQGKNADEVKARIESGEIIEPTSSPRSNKVFVVYGHDETLKLELETLLRRWSLEPVILDKLPSGGQTIIEKLEHQLPNVEYGIVLATPDDVGYRKDAPQEAMFRCRQNVVLEMGMLLSKLGRDRIAILQQYPKQTERPSDIQGLLYIPFEEHIQPEASKLLALEIEHKLGRVISASQL